MGPREDSLQRAIPLFRDKWWRLNNLYWIIDKKGDRVLFTCNDAQTRFFKSMHFLNIILKARQLGFSTFVDLYILDECLFNSNVEAGIIADTESNAKDIYRRKIQFPYNNLLPEIRAACPRLIDNVEKTQFANGSVISCGVSFRSGTLHYLHISEFGKIAAKWPDRAREIVTGTLPALATGQIGFIESTAQGRSGYFYDMWKRASDHTATGDRLSAMDWKPHFYPWHENVEYVCDEPTCITSAMLDYFAAVEGKIGRALPQDKRAWYVRMHAVLGEDMKSEYPSTPDEAFDASIEGAYFSKQFSKIRAEKRMCAVPIVASSLVDTWWDLGINDTMAIWFTQDVGREIRVIDFYENSGEGLPHYIAMLSAKKYLYGRHYAPHDIGVRELTTGKSRYEAAQALGLKFEIVPRIAQKMDAIEAARSILSYCWFDEARTAEGVAHMEAYRKAWDDTRNCWKDHPLHNEHSNGADAFQTLACGHTFADDRSHKVAQPVKRSAGYAW